MIFFPNPKLEEELKREPDFQACQRTAGEALKRSVRSVAPYGSGAYRNSIEVVQVGEDLVVATTDFAGHIIEWGSVKSPAYAPLRRGARAAGFRLVES